MAKTKTRVEQVEKKSRPSAPADQVKPTPEMQGGPIRQRRAASSVSCCDARRQSPSEMSSAPERAQMTAAAQRQSGNARLDMLGTVQAKIPVGAPGDRMEQEADKAATRVVSGQKVAGISRVGAGGLSSQLKRQAPEDEDEKPMMQQLQRQVPKEKKPAQEQTSDEEEGEQASKPQGAARAVRRAEDEEEEEEEPAVSALRLQRRPAEGEAIENAGMEARLKAPGAGRPLPGSVRTEMEAGLGADFSSVRLHDTAEDQAAAKGLNAKAFAYRNHVWMGPGASSGDKKLMAHELTHVVQQGSAGRSIRRYEAGEHAKLGETQTEVKTALAPTTYRVKRGERLKDIAAKFSITVEELKAANKQKLKIWRARSGNGRLIEGFNAGEEISVPQNLNELAKTITKDKAAKFTINGVVLEYGVGMAMGDFFESPDQMARAPAKEIKALAALIRREQSGGKPVTTQEWQQATGGRYLALAEKNAAHFAPPSKKLVTPTSAGAASANHKTEWQKHHKSALDVSKSGYKDKALAINAYGDHFLTDAFSAGHLINKRDVMEKFKSQFTLDAKGEEFIGASKKFFDDVAADAFTGAVKTEFSKYETHAPYTFGWRPNINSPSRLSSLLQGIHKKKPDLVSGAVAKAVHDRLNVVPGGVPVENAVGDRWNLSGDGALNTQTKAIAKKAVAQSQLNLTAVFKTAMSIKYGVFFKNVWDYTPRPSVAGIKQVVSEIKKGVVLGSAVLKRAVVKLIKDNYKLMIKELEKRKELRKA